MKNSVLLWLMSVLLALGSVTAQPHFSNAFVLEDEWTLEKNSDNVQPQGMVGCVHGNVLYCCHRRGFQNKEEGYRATVWTMDLTTGEEAAFSLGLPEKKATAVSARKYWIRGVCAEEGRILLLVQNGVLVYQLGKGGRYDFVRKIGADLPDRMVAEGGRLTVVERVPEEGRFVVRRQHDRTGALDSVLGVALPGPFLIQYDPNGFVKMAEGSLYFLASPELRIEKYAYSGDLQTVIEPQIPEWLPMPGELVRKISAMPYSSDRAMYTFSQGKRFSFPLEISPLNDSTLWLAYHQYSLSEGKEQILSVLVHYDAKGTVKKVEGPYAHFFPRDSVMGGEVFPLYYARRELCLQVTDGNRIVQVVREAPVEWRGKTGRQYTDSAERYLADGLPVVRVRVARLRTGGGERRCAVGDLGLRTYEGAAFSGGEIPAAKAVFIVNNPPQCRSCERSLSDLLNTVDTSVCKIFIVFNNADGFLAKRDLLADVRRHLAVPFVPLFVPTEAKEAFLDEMGTPLYPLILLKEAGTTEASIVPNGQIFTEDLASSTLKKEFVRKFTLFLHRFGGAGK